MSIGRSIRLMLYYSFARYLPASSTRFGLWARWVRRIICSGIFKSAGKNINIEKGAYFGSGACVEIGDNSGIGISCRITGPVKIGKDVMIGPDVIIPTHHHGYDC